MQRRLAPFSQGHFNVRVDYNIGPARNWPDLGARLGGFVILVLENVWFSG